MSKVQYKANKQESIGYLNIPHSIPWSVNLIFPNNDDDDDDDDHQLGIPGYI